ncbi:hypothetical protein, partial [Klebsiella pneumoniae]|uniref:hypothetical protein n=1 Tax=Klebsiella pneumoniae TaxID=573 RepID=UPI002730ABC6
PKNNTFKVIQPNIFYNKASEKFEPPSEQHHMLRIIQTKNYSKKFHKYYKSNINIQYPYTRQ